MPPWRVFQQAARADARALRLLDPGTRHRPTDLAAALDDADYLEARRHANQRTQAWRKRTSA